MRLFSCAFLIFFTLLASQAHSKVVGETVEYKTNGTVLKGYLAYDDSVKGKRPGVLLVHEWWGLNNYVRKRADMIAGLGYTALAVDMYGDGKNSEHPADAQKFAAEVMNNMAIGEKRFNAALEFLKKQPTVNPDEIAAIGYCFGGAIALHMARIGTDLDGVVSFHGNLGSTYKALPDAVKAKILVLTGGDDNYVPPEEVDAFRKEMDAAHADYEIIVYPGAKHSFTNPDSDRLGKENDLSIAYNEEADKKSWAEMQKFLKEIFNQGSN
ncbi:MAG TPA: dienelactone hydrolase family protein [Thermodesulfobacteriota bacterium]|nr:dienelactone hydrolase family protein [Thermodesulfobacteriota bacterium]